MYTGLLLCCLLALTTGQDILNGTVANEGQFPWQLLLSDKDDTVHCGAVLIKPNVALAAAHCAHYLGPDLHVTGGQHNLEEVSGNEVTLNVSSYILHPDMDLEASGYPNDLALLHLTNSFNTEGAYIKTIPMAQRNGSDFAGEMCTVTGWGNYFIDHPSPTLLKYINVGCITNAACQDKFTNFPEAEINDGHICVFEAGKTTCFTEGGGPMVCGGVLAGITSFGLTDCNDLFPTVYTRVSYFRDWIDSNI